MWIFFAAHQITKEQVDIAHRRLPPSYPQKIRLSIYPTGISSNPDMEPCRYELTVLGFKQEVSFTLIPSSASKPACRVIMWIRDQWIIFLSLDAPTSPSAPVPPPGSEVANVCHRQGSSCKLGTFIYSWDVISNTCTHDKAESLFVLFPAYMVVI